MLHQYFPQRARHAEIGGRAVMVGTVPVGTLTAYRGERIIVSSDFRSACNKAPEFAHHLGRTSGSDFRKTLWAWLPRECHAGRFDRSARTWASSFHARGMFLAQVRSLATGRRFRLSDVHLIEREP